MLSASTIHASSATTGGGVRIVENVARLDNVAETGEGQETPGTQKGPLGIETGPLNRNVVHGVLGVLLASRISLNRGMPSVTFCGHARTVERCGNKTRVHVE